LITPYDYYPIINHCQYLLCEGNKARQPEAVCTSPRRKTGGLFYAYAGAFSDSKKPSRLKLTLVSAGTPNITQPTEADAGVGWDPTFFASLHRFKKYKRSYSP
jgi:hypothetical protein